MRRGNSARLTRKRRKRLQKRRTCKFQQGRARPEEAVRRRMSVDRTRASHSMAAQCARRIDTGGRSAVILHRDAKNEPASTVNTIDAWQKLTSTKLCRSATERTAGAAKSHLRAAVAQMAESAAYALIVASDGRGSRSAYSNRTDWRLAAVEVRQIRRCAKALRGRMRRNTRRGSRRTERTERSRRQPPPADKQRAIRNAPPRAARANWHDALGSRPTAPPPATCQAPPRPFKTAARGAAAAKCRARDGRADGWRT